MKPDDEGGWDIFITYGAGYDFNDPIRAIAMVANGKKGWFGWPENAGYEKLRAAWAEAPTGHGRNRQP